MGETKLRIYVGGLGPNVKEDDLKQTFGSLGSVESVELNRNKGRSFGYMEFIPSSQKSLLKLFSAYNGCMWKGGKLKLEKAREHYISRLKREWDEEAELAAAKLAKQNVVKDNEVVRAPTEFRSRQDMEKMQIKVYFPKLRKIRPLPFKGTGKHKYSFQRVQVPPLPINFCDCEEHSALASENTEGFFQLVSAPISGKTEQLVRLPVVAAKRKNANDIEPEAFMVTEQEVDIMKSVLNKLVEKENSSSKVSNQSKFIKKINHPATSGGNSQVDESEEVQVSDHDDDDDDDDVVINVVGRSSNRVDPFEDWRPKATVNQDSLSTRMESVTESQKMKLQHDKKRKAPASETETNDDRPSKRMMNNENLSSISGPKTMQLCLEVPPVRKTAWKNLVAEKGSTFHISDILTDLNAKESKESVERESDSMESAENESQSKESSESESESAESESEADESAESENEADESAESESEADESAESESEPEESAESGSQPEEAAESESQPEEAAESESQPEEAAEGENQQEEAAESENLSFKAGESEIQSKEPVESGTPESAENEKHDDQKNENKELEIPSADNKPDKLIESDNKSARGAAWLHKSSWTQLVADKSFSLSDILPGGTSEKLQFPEYESNVFPDSKDVNFLAGDTSKHGEGVEEVLVEKHNDTGLSKDKISSDGDKKVGNNNRVLVRKDVVVSETCPFMRSAASMKDWAKTKAALSRSLKKKTKVKEMDSD